LREGITNEDADPYLLGEIAAVLAPLGQLLWQYIGVMEVD
jgi:hypothetical protein